MSAGRRTLPKELVMRTSPHPRPDINPATIAATVRITAATGADHQFTDTYGVTYTGAPAHLALFALARRDITAGIHTDQPAIASGIRAVASTLIRWFTGPHVDPDHAAEFAVLLPKRVCELVVYLLLHGEAAALSNVGPLRTPPFGNRRLAEQSAEPGDQIYCAEIAIPPDDVHALS